MLKALLKDEAGFVISTELVLVATILVLGLIVGQATLRDNVVTELADVAAAVGAIDQTYQFSHITGHSASTAGSQYLDAQDFCDDTNGGSQGFAPGLTNGTCVTIGAAGANDGGDSGNYATLN